MSENVIRTSFSSLMNGCPKCKSKNLYLVCGIESGKICADCGWHDEGLKDWHAKETLKSIKACGGDAE